MSRTLIDHTRSWSAAELARESVQARQLLARLRCQRLATLLDNGAAFVILDELAISAGLVHAPLPLFFSAAQIRHALVSAGIDTLIAAAQTLESLGLKGFTSFTLADQTLGALKLNAAEDGLPLINAGTARLTFTSGSTGEPKGVCLSADAMRRVASGIEQATSSLSIERHLCALPFAVLLENIAGLMAPRQRGAVCVTVPLASLGLHGSSQFDPARFDQAVNVWQPNSVILLPQMLRAWATYLHMTQKSASSSLRLVAVGGARVGKPLLDRARSVGIPAFEGYGLSEASSVVSLNLPDADRAGSAGRVLPHAKLRLADDGEVLVQGGLFSGYLGMPSRDDNWWATGDVGSLDEDGYLWLQGRKRNILMTGFGRNVSPEWVETELCSEACIAQAVVLGEGEPHLSAVLWPTRTSIEPAEVAKAVARCNERLPDYARIKRWVCADQAFDSASGMATANGRPRRDAVACVHARDLGLRMPSINDLEREETV